MQYKKYSIGPYNLHVVKTNKFKSINIKINFRRPTVREEITIRNFLSDLLLYSTTKYPSNRLLSTEAENLYGSMVLSENTRVGNYALISFYLKVLNEKYTEEGMFGKSLDLLLEIIFNPNISNKKFDSQAFKIVKNSIESEIKSVKDNMTKYSLIRMLEEMDSKSPISYRSYGYLEDLEKLDEAKLCEYYETMIKSDLVDIFILGDVDFVDIKKLMTNKIPLNTIKRNTMPVIIEHDKIRRRIRKIRELEDISQSKLSIGCKVEKMTDTERKYILSLYSIILGGPASSKLFNTIREKHSLAYYINCQPKLVDSTLLIYAGIDKDKFEKTLKLIKLEMDNMKKGLFTDEELDSAKHIAISAIKSAEDSAVSIINSYLSKELIKSDDLETKIKNILLVSKDEIIKLAKKVNIDTVFLLEGGRVDAEDEV